MDKFEQRVMRAMGITFNLFRPGPTDDQTYPNNSLIIISKLLKIDYFAACCIQIYFLSSTEINLMVTRQIIRSSLFIYVFFFRCFFYNLEKKLPRM